jgi:hypothetical protein
MLPFVGQPILAAAAFQAAFFASQQTLPQHRLSLKPHPYRIRR